MTQNLLVFAGAQYMNDEEAQAAGQNNMRHKHATHDLFNHIGAGKEAIWVSLTWTLFSFSPQPD